MSDAGSDDLAYLSVCNTAKERGHCVTPTDALVFEGCLEVPTELPGSITRDTIVAHVGDEWSMNLVGSYECETNDLAATHPDDWNLGDQVVQIAAGELPEGEPVEIVASMLTWRSSYRANVECSFIEDKGETCTCTWDYREGFEIERGSMVREGAWVHIDLAGSVGDDEYLLWGRFPIAE